MKTLEVEVDGPLNENLFFMPLGKRVRGRFDVRRIREPNAMRLLNTWPDGIPGQRLGIDLDSGDAWLADPLHDPDHAHLAEKIQATGQRLPPAREAFPGQHVPTWLWWLSGAVKSGKAKIVKGTLPAKIDGEPQTTGFITHRPKPIEARLADAIEQQTMLLADVMRTLKPLLADAVKALKKD